MSKILKMSPHSQIYLLRKAQPGLVGVLDRLAEVGYILADLPEKGTAEKGVALLCLGRESKYEELEQELPRLRKLTPNLEWIALFSGKLKMKFHSLYALGFEQIYQIPLDEDLFANRIFEMLPLEIPVKELKFEHLQRVNVPVLKDVAQVPFDIFVYLPSNRKIMLYFREGVTFDAAQLERFEKHKNYPLFIRKTDIGRYKNLSGEALKKIKNTAGVSDDVKVEMVQEHVHNLMGPFFSEGELSDDEGRQTILQLQAMLRGLQVSPTLEDETIVSLEKLSSQKMTNASHSNNVATYCALFGLALGHKNLDELRLGGLLHDVGLADLPLELLGRDETSMSAEDRARYHLHPGNGKTDVVNRKVPVTETVLNMILFHHERPDGSGYPYGKKSEEIPVEAQICAFADEFDKWTSMREGYRCYTPKEAMLLLSGQLGQPADRSFNPAVHQKIVDFYLSAGHAAGGVEIAPGTPIEVGDVKVASSKTKIHEHKKMEHGIGLEQIAQLRPLKPGASVEIDGDIHLEVMALEKELEFYFMENGLK